MKNLSSIVLLVAACGPPSSIEADALLANLDAHIGKRVVVKARFKNGARCRQDEGDWKTYCKDCQYCRGPFVIDSALNLPKEGLDDWPLILGGTYEGRDIRCTGPINAIDCYPFTPGQTYVVQGRLEASHPPKLLVQRFWRVDG
jgi:hypothetical protein